MCMRRFVISRTMLGNREQGWVLDDGVSISEMTSKEIVTALSKGQEIYGLAVGSDGTLVPDGEFFTRNIMEHRQVGNYKPMIDDDECVANVFYIVTGQNEKGEYTAISTKHERTVLSGERCRVMLEMKVISAGAKLEDGRIVLPCLDRAGNGKEKAGGTEKAQKPVEKKEKASKPGKAVKADTDENSGTK